MQEIALKMQTDQGIEQLVHQLHWGNKSSAQPDKKRPRTAKAKVKQPTEKAPQTDNDHGEDDVDEQIRVFKQANKKQIKDLKKGSAI